MKVCPVCSETFGDDLKFCDIDGARLVRQMDGAHPQGHSKVWSLLGIGLLVGALALSAISVFIIPKSRPSPTSANTEAQPYTPTNKPGTPDASSATTNPTDNSSTVATADQPEIVAEGLPPDPKKKDKAKALIDDGTGGTKLNPKAAAQSGEEEEKPAPPKEEPLAPPPAPKKVEPAVSVKPVSETRETEVAPKPTTAEPKKDAKNAKDADKKKNDDKDKKKGGFFRVFKKIFGKD